MTIDDIEPDAVHYGIQLADMDEGERHLALGTHDSRRAVAAVCRYIRDMGVSVRDYHCLRPHRAATPLWATFRRPDSARGEHADCPWVCEPVAARSTGAGPVVWVEAELAPGPLLCHSQELVATGRRRGIW